MLKRKECLQLMVKLWLLSHHLPSNLGLSMCTCQIGYRYKFFMQLVGGKWRNYPRYVFPCMIAMMEKVCSLFQVSFDRVMFESYHAKPDYLPREVLSTFSCTGPFLSQWVTTEMGFFLMEDKFMHGIKNINQKIIYRVKSNVVQWHCLVLSWKKTWVWIPHPPTCKGKKKQHLWIHSFSSNVSCFSYHSHLSFYRLLCRDVFRDREQTTNWCFLPCLM